MKNRFFAVAMLMLLSFAACTRGTSSSTDQNDLNSDEQGTAHEGKSFEGTCTVTELYPGTPEDALISMDLLTNGERVFLPGVTAMGCKEGTKVGDTFKCGIYYTAYVGAGGANPWGTTSENCTYIEGWSTIINRFQVGCIYKSLSGVCNLKPETAGEKNRSFDFVWTTNGVSNTISNNTLPDYKTGHEPKLENENSFKCTVSVKTTGKDSCESCIFTYPANSYAESPEFACSSAAEQLLRAKMQ